MHKQLISFAAAILLPVISLASSVPEGFEKPENYPDPLRLEAEIKAYEWIDYVMAPSENYEFVQYVDIATPMIEGGRVQSKYLNTDDLHMNAAGYDLWRDIVQREVVVRESLRLP